MNFRKLPDNDLSHFAKNLALQLAGTNLTSIDTTVRTDLAASIGTLPATLATQTAAAADAESARKAAISAKNDTRAQIIALMSQVRDALKAGLAQKKEYDIAGFDFPNTPPSPYVAVDPTELSASGFSNGINKGKFAGNNRNGQVVYEVWRRQGADGAWALHSTTKKQAFTDTPVTPGQYYEYRIRAVAAKTTSNFSNSAIVYGVL